MKKLELKKVNHSVKVGDSCGEITPNITEDTIFYDNGDPIGFYLKKIPSNLKKFIDIANKELLSDRVPKSTMKRSSGVLQYSTILGGVPPKPNMRRNYKSISSVHRSKSAKNFIKSMLLACKESEKLIKEIIPEQYEKQLKVFEKVEGQYKFGNLFTSSISNCNISAPFHRDTGNIKDTVNVIIVKKKGAKGGNTTIPDYNATVDSCDDSMLVYPAWRNVHGVTPIVETHKGGYRNSLVFYPLKAFLEE